jgi:phage-related protein
LVVRNLFSLALTSTIEGINCTIEGIIEGINCTIEGIIEGINCTIEGINSVGSLFNYRRN